MDEILELNNQVTGLIKLLNISQEEIPDIRDLKNKDDEYDAWSILLNLRDKLDEAIDLIIDLKDFEYD